MDIRIELQDTEVRRGLNRLTAAGADLSPAMGVIAIHLADRAEESFQSETSPSGAPWAPPAPVTVKERKRKGFTPVKLLQRQGVLARSILAHWDERSAVAGTNLIYAATHQFGAKKGQYGQGAYKTRKGSFPIPWGDVPARPFLGVGPADRAVIEKTLRAFIAKAWR